MGIVLTALGAALLLAGGQPDATALHSFVGLTKVSNDPANPQHPGGGGGRFALAEGTPWITGDDMPADLRARRLETDTYVAVAVDAAGRAGDCRLVTASSEPRLDALACPLLLRRGRFTPRYVTPTRTVAGHWVIRVSWRTLPRPAPGGPTTAPRPNTVRYEDFEGWPRFDWASWVRTNPLPAIQPFYPRTPDRREGVVGLELMVNAGHGVTGCEIRASAGDALLDEAACRAARTIDLTYYNPCDAICKERTLPLQVVWRAQGSHIRLPLPAERDPLAWHAPRDPADDRPATRPVLNYPVPPFPPLIPRRADFADIAVPGDYRRFFARLLVGANGRVTACTVTRSGGSEAFDQHVCRFLADRHVYGPRRDIFGDPAPGAANFGLGPYELAD